MNYQESVKYILDIPKFTVKNHLTHTKEFLLRLGNPQVGRKVIHVARDKWKGLCMCIHTGSFACGEKEDQDFSCLPIL